MTDGELARRDAAWKRYKEVLEPRDDRSLAREAFNEAWFECLKSRAALTAGERGDG